ncbi:FGGY family carbohydrate kinase [Verrucomicrobiaceae bacterium 227]
MYFLGVESAESSTTALVVDLKTAKVVASACKEHHLVEGVPAGHREQDPRMWILAIDHAVKECLTSLGADRDLVVAMSISAQSQGMVLLDEDNQVLRPAKIAGDDSARKQLDLLHRNFGGAPGLSELLGNRVEIDSLAPKLLWVREHEPSLFQKVVSVMQPREFLNFWLTGVRKAEAGEASVSGLLDVVNRQWSEDLTGFIDSRLLGMLSPLAGVDEIDLGILRPEIAESWDLRREIRVALGSGIPIMRALSLGNVRAGTAVLELGAKGELGAFSEMARVDPRSEVSLRSDASGNWLASVYEERAVSSLEMVRVHYGWSEAEMMQAASKALPGAGGLVVLPLGHGLRGQEGSGMFHGLTPANFTPENVARATLEGIAIGLSGGFHRMEELGMSFEEIRVAGRGAEHQFWRQLIADVTGVPCCSLLNDEGGAMGAAIYGAVNFLRENGEPLSFSGMVDHVVRVDPDSRCEPDEERKKFYLEELARQQYLAETLIGAGFLS